MVKNIVICDSNLQRAKETESLIKKFSIAINIELGISLYCTGSGLLEYCNKTSCNVDMIFIDIELDDTSGIDVVKKINRTNPNCYIVYLTDSTDYAMAVYETKHIFYIIRNELPDRLAQIRDKVCKFESESNSVINIALPDNEYKRVRIGDIICVERIKRIVYITTIEDEFRTVLSLDDLEKTLGHNQFIRCHNSILISTKHVIAYKRDKFQLRGGKIVSVSRKYQQEVRNKFYNWVNLECFTGNNIEGDTYL